MPVDLLPFPDPLVIVAGTYLVGVCLKLGAVFTRTRVASENTKKPER